MLIEGIIPLSNHGLSMYVDMYEKLGQKRIIAFDEYNTHVSDEFHLLVLDGIFKLVTIKELVLSGCIGWQKCLHFYQHIRDKELFLVFCKFFLCLAHILLEDLPEVGILTRSLALKISNFTEATLKLNDDL